MPSTTQEEVVVGGAALGGVEGGEGDGDGDGKGATGGIDAMQTRGRGKDVEGRRGVREVSGMKIG